MNISNWSTRSLDGISPYSLWYHGTITIHFPSVHCTVEGKNWRTHVSWASFAELIKKNSFLN